MSTYTTGELAKLCNVSVRTVQYYDERGILIPTSLSEGGRRLFTDKDLKMLETICFLRELGISIKDIASILESKESKEVVELLLSQYSEDLEKELQEKQTQLNSLRTLQKEMKNYDDASENTIHDISITVNARKKLRKLYVKIIPIIIIAEIIEIIAFVLGIKTGNWLLCVGAVIAYLGMIFFGANYIYKRVAYICPQCHNTFAPGIMEYCLAVHTPRTRKLNCTECGRKIWCVEIYRD